MKSLSWVGVGLLTVAALAPGFAQHRRDPLNPLEIDQLRDAAQDPDQRLKLYTQFARARLDALDKMRADPKTSDRAGGTRDRLQDFVDVYDELNENIDNFDDRGSDLRKALKGVIEGDTEFQSRLRALRDSATATPAETKTYQFLLSTALDTVDSGVADHRKLLAEQEQAAKHRPKAEPKRSAE
jgi:hypothetical protein